MDKSKNASAWTEQGYALFAEEGFDGIQVERLARMLRLNKSGFYHYFGDMDVYCEEIIKLHNGKADHFLQDVGKVENLDPDYLLLLIKHAPTVMFQVHLIREKNGHSFYQASEAIDQKVSLAVQQLWSNFLGAPANSNLALRYFCLVRDMFYNRISFQNLNYPFLHDLVTEAKQLVSHLTHHHLPHPNGVLR